MACVSKVFCLCGNKLDIINLGMDDNNEIIVTVQECSICKWKAEEIARREAERKVRENEKLSNEQTECIKIDT
uniref:Uncharacterized protein n=1 Tax=viral metagenome TaxID=1070528 RepID=A0A6M3LAQ5_9ZZZZ